MDDLRHNMLLIVGPKSSKTGSLFDVSISVSDPDPLQETWIRIRITKKNRDKLS